MTGTISLIQYGETIFTSNYASLIDRQKLINQWARIIPEPYELAIIPDLKIDNRPVVGKKEKL